ncbi:MAG: response regulator transcription factor [Bacteroidia bacterium]|jgi:two-component system alkaline phosphatase synthesis response regulator PhoP|nr:response regulator transcription factor [Bacteroidia bacterium]
MSSTILIVEDEANLANAISLNLKAEGYVVLLARNGKEAKTILNSSLGAIDLIMLDVMLPDASGFELCKQIKTARAELPVIFLTAKNQSFDKIEGLKLGADDYITKPFDLEEVLLRIRNLLKRANKASEGIFKFKNGEVHFSTFEIVSCAGEKISLSKREMGLLELLTRQANKVISRDEIIEKLWSADENPSSRTIDNYVLNFRKYFEPNPKEPIHFHSVRGVGYKFTD